MKKIKLLTSIAGLSTLAAACGGLATSCSTSEKQISSLIVTTASAEKEVGKKFESSDIVVKAQYKDNTTEVINWDATGKTGYEITDLTFGHEFTQTELGQTKKFTVIYKGIVKSGEIKVVKSTADTFKVHFNVGSCPTAIADQAIEKGGLVVKPAAEWSGYKLEGWFKESTFENAWDFATDTVTAETTLFAKWKEDTPTTDKFKVEFDANGGTYVDTQLVENGQKATQPTCTKESYELVGWYSDSSFTTQFDFDTAITQDTKLYAKWRCPLPPTTLTCIKYQARTDGEEGLEVYWDSSITTEDCPETIRIPEKATDPADGTEKPVTAVAQNAFKKNKGSSTSDTNPYLISIELPDTITKIGDGAFFGCLRLTDINIPDSCQQIGVASNYLMSGYVVGAFNGCYSLKNITLSSNSQLKIVGSGTFANCVSLKSIALPDAVEQFGVASFSATGIESFKFPKKVTTIPQSLFGSYSGYLSIQASTAIKEVYFNNVTTINQYAFRNCTSLDSTKLHFETDNPLTSIGQYAFQNCTSFTSFTIGKNVNDIGTNAFDLCSNLTSATFEDTTNWYKTLTDPTATPEEITGLEDQTTAATKIKTGYIKKDTSVSGLIFATTSSNASVCWDGTTTLSKLIIPSICNKKGYSYSVSEFANRSGSVGAFEGCTSITTVDIPDSIITINENCFKGCTSLSSINISSNITDFGADAFTNCNALSSAVFDDTTNRWLIKDASGTLVKPSALTASEMAALIKTNSSYAWRKYETIENISLTLNEGKTGATVTHKSQSSQSPVIIPNTCEIDGSIYPVIAIEDSAWSYTYEKSVFIPKSIKTIGSGAFSNGYGLSKVVFEEDSQLEEIGSGAFQFADGETLQSIEFGSKLKTIGSYLFSKQYESHIDTIKFDSDCPLTEFPLYSLCNCGVVNINIPKNVTKLVGDQWNPPIDTSNLTSLTFDDRTSTWSIASYDAPETEVTTFTPSGDPVADAESYKTYAVGYIWTKNS